MASLSYPSPLPWLTRALLMNSVLSSSLLLPRSDTVGLFLLSPLNILQFFPAQVCQNHESTVKLHYDMFALDPPWTPVESASQKGTQSNAKCCVSKLALSTLVNQIMSPIYLRLAGLIAQTENIRLFDY